MSPQANSGVYYAILVGFIVGGVKISGVIRTAAQAEIAQATHSQGLDIVISEPPAHVRGHEDLGIGCMSLVSVKW